MENLNKKFTKRSSLIVLMMVSLSLILAFGLSIPASAQQNDFETVYPQANNEFFTNPGIGWQRMEHNRPAIGEETVVYPTREDISWRTLNPGLNNYNWSVLDNKIQAADNNGQLFSFRIYTMQGESYGGHHVPQFVLNRDNRVIQGGDPDYSNCTYQQYWAVFVDALIQRYDGDQRIAFIDISGYGNFNEWSWTDDQTVWEDDFLNPTSLDGQARSRLAEMFIGGSSNNHDCRGSNGSTQTVSYDYAGFQSTQLVMPFAGIQQSTRYVAAQRDDVGIRYDCLGRDARLDRIEDVIENTWRTAPIVFEFCANSTTRADVINRAETLMNTSHGVIVHENLENPRDEGVVEDFMTNVGYRYQLTQAVYDSSIAAGDELSLSMAWQNVGTSPAYTSMGYDFELHVYLLDNNGNMVLDHTSDANVTWWMPAHPLPGTAPTNSLGELISIPDSVPDGNYELRVGIVNIVSNETINLAIQGDDGQGRYLIGTVNVDGEVAPPVTEVPTEEPTEAPTEPPTEEPTEAPTEPPTEEPTEAPTEPPTEEPTEAPTEPPTEEPTELPTEEPASGYVYLAGVAGEVIRIRNTTWVVRVEIQVENNDGNPQSGVTVSGVWQDGTPFSCTTNNNGLCRVRNTSVPLGQNASATVSNLEHDSLSYNGAMNEDSPIEVISQDDGATEEPPVTEQPPVTEEPPTSDYIYIDSIETQYWTAGAGLWAVFIDINVADDNGQTPSGVTVTGIWHDGSEYSCTTSWGWCGARMGDIPATETTVSLTITGLSYDGHAYNADANNAQATINVSLNGAPTEEPPVVVPPTEEPPVVVPPTEEPPVVVPPTEEPPVVVPPTEEPPVTGDYIYVAEMDAQEWEQGRGRWTAYIDIEIRTSNGRAPSGVLVTGVWHDGTPYSCTTGGGWCGARLNDIPTSVGTATLTITHVSHSSLSFNTGVGTTSVSINQ